MYLFIYMGVEGLQQCAFSLTLLDLGCLLEVCYFEGMLLILIWVVVWYVGSPCRLFPCRLPGVRSELASFPIATTMPAIQSHVVDGF